MSAQERLSAIPIKPLFALFKRAEQTPLANASKRVKYMRLRDIADDVFTLVKSQTPCGNGCSHCCHMAVAMTDTEAAEISQKIGKPYKRQPKLHPVLALRHHRQLVREYQGVPCVFLKDGACSIYEHRPIACRSHHSLADTPDPCRLDIADPQKVPSLDVKELEMAYASCFVTEAFGDIREYFPK